jgi:hypothetical protein
MVQTNKYIPGRGEPPVFDRRLWTCWRRQHRHGVGNRVPGFQTSRIPLSPAHDRRVAYTLRLNKSPRFCLCCDKTGPGVLSESGMTERNDDRDTRTNLGKT